VILRFSLFLVVGTINAMGFPPVQGLYDPRNEHDACGMGFVAHIKGVKSHAIIGQALEILRNLDHRGAVGADPLLGDGAGLLIQLPDQMFRKWAASEGKELPQPGDYAVAMCFLPQDEAAPHFREFFEKFIAKEGQELIGWRACRHARRPWQDRDRIDAGDPPVLHQARRELRRSGRLRAQAARHPQADAEPAGGHGRKAWACRA
jgi:hypothetical protein